MTKNNFFVFTGGPGSGKTSLLRELQTQGYSIVEEAGRRIIQEQLEMGGDAVHGKNRLKFRELMMHRMVADYQRMLSSTSPVLFDRGLPGLIGYSYLIGEPVSTELLRSVEDHRYNRDVFMTPPWEAIYINDAERHQPYSEAVDTFEKIKGAYEQLGYRVIELPKVGLMERAKFVRRYIDLAVSSRS